MGFKKPPSSEVMTWSWQPDQRPPPEQLRVSDVLECRYLWDGLMQLWLNDGLLWDFNVGRAVEELDDYAVVDVCFSAVSLTQFCFPSHPSWAGFSSAVVL